MTCSRCGEIPIHREDEEGFIRQFPINGEINLQCPACPKNYQWALALGGIIIPMFVAYTITRK